MVIIKDIFNVQVGFKDVQEQMKDTVKPTAYYSRSLDDTKWKLKKTQNNLMLSFIVLFTQYCT